MPTKLPQHRPTPFPPPRAQDNVEQVLEVATKYAIASVLDGCEGFLTRRELTTGPGRSDVLKWLATADRLGLKATVKHCLKTLRQARCLQGVQLVGSSPLEGCPNCYLGECLQTRLLNKAYLVQLQPTTLAQLLLLRP
jgi:hypothetical protein